MLADLAERLASRGHEVEVFTTKGGYAGKPASQLQHGQDVRISLAWTPGEKLRLLAWIAFLLQAFVAVAWKRWDRCVFLTDPPFLGICGIVGNWFGLRRKAMYLWAMDLYPESLVAQGMIRVGSVVERFLRWCVGKSFAQLTGVVCLDESQRSRLATYRTCRHLARAGEVIPPWDNRKIPDALTSENRFLRAQGLTGRKIALYAGNLGQAHAYESLIEAAKRMAAAGRTDWMFVFVVRGTRREALQSAGGGAKNVRILDYQPEEWTADLLHAATVHLITMKMGWEGIVVPSKLYGVLSTGKPVLFVGPRENGTAQEVIRLGAGIVLPEDSSARDIVVALDELATREGLVTDHDASSRIARLSRFITGDDRGKAAVS